jgi:hypothetical protein
MFKAGDVLVYTAAFLEVPAVSSLMCRFPSYFFVDYSPVVFVALLLLVN